MLYHTVRARFATAWIVAALAVSVTAQQGPKSSQDDLLPALASNQQWKMVWRDEFTGKEIDSTKWESPEYERRGHLWRAANAYLDTQGHLVMKTSKQGERFASPCLRTKGKFEKKYGLFVTRCKLPRAQGHWSAFWLHGDSVGKVGNDGRDGTEIDIMEWPYRDGRVQHALHWDGYGEAHKSKGHVSRNPALLDGEFHTFALAWSPEEYVFYVDNKETWRTKAGGVCQVPLYIKLSVEIGKWAGDIKQARLPDFFTLDYVRVYDAVRKNDKTLTETLSFGDGLDAWACHLADPDLSLQDVWQVEQDVLICKGTPLGYLYTQQDYTDFRLRLEWRWPPGKEPGKGGVLLRMTQDHRIWPKSLEAQLNVGDAGAFWGLAGYGLSGTPDRMQSLEHPKFGKLTNLKKTKALERTPGLWNTYDIIAQGETVILRVNGEEVNRASGCAPDPGKICLTSEGTEIQFRNIVLTELEAGGVSAPAPFGPVPAARQIQWHKRGYYGFIHFTVNTFTDKEWGMGDEDNDIFNPTALDCRQWARTFRAAGMKGLILTCKHHDGFCLWPSKYTRHSVKYTRWGDGKRDVVKEAAAACREYGLDFGVYLSPWDRNHAEYGRPAYIEYFKQQLEELLTQYGDIAEVWFDGANGGTGYYGGANEERRIDRHSYYPWPEFHAIVRRLQPMACMFSDAGPDCRWVGNESGSSAGRNWARFDRDAFYPGYTGPRSGELTTGKADGTHWVPAEVDVSIRPGWFYHRAQDKAVKGLDHLLNIYYSSVGNNANLLLNIPPDRRGLIHETDQARLSELGQLIEATFAKDLGAGAGAHADSTRASSPRFAAGNTVDNDPETYWCTNDDVTTAVIELDLGQETSFDNVMLQEYIKLGQRVSGFRVEALIDGTWQEICKGATIGYKRLLRFKPVTARRIRLHILEARACPVIAKIGLYRSPS